MASGKSGDRAGELLAAEELRGRSKPSPILTALLLAAIVLLGASLRLANLGQSPPGLNQDEAANAFNTYSILKTGRDQVGRPWPIFFSRCLGENRSTLFIYYLMPFQAVGGLNVYTLRFASAFGGIVTILLMYFVAARMFERTAGLLAAGLLAVNPWHIQQCRWGHEAAIAPLLIILPWALMLAANLPFGQDKPGRCRPVIAGLAGLAMGVSCYGYPAVRLFIPTFAIGVILVTCRQWWRLLKNARGIAAVAAMVIGLSVTFGPLAWQHVVNPDVIAKRGKTTAVWNHGDDFAAKSQAVLKRYAGHFGPDFLFVRGDLYQLQSPPGMGLFHWYMLPLILAGLMAAGVAARRSAAARVVIVGLVVYPAGDILSRHMVASEAGMHALRSLPGLCGLVLLASYGALAGGTFLWRKARSLAPPIFTAAGVAVVAMNVTYLQSFFGKFGEFNRRPGIYHGYHVDLLQACDWLRPRLEDLDAVFVTTIGMNQPYIISLVSLGYDPVQWFKDEKVVETPSEWDLYLRYGKMHFMYWQYAAEWAAKLNELKSNGRGDRTVFIIREWEADILRERLRIPLTLPVLTISGPPDTNPLLVYEIQL